MSNNYLKAKYIDAYKANSFILKWRTSAYCHKVLLLVEGTADIEFLFPFINGDICEIRCAGGCSNVEKVIKVIRNVTGDKIKCLAIIDADFSRLENRKPVVDDLFYTDTHDHEMMCIACSNALKNLFEGFAIPYKKEIMNTIYEDLRYLSYIKWYVHQNYSYYNTQSHYHVDDVNVNGMSTKELRSLCYLVNEIQRYSPNCTGLTVEVVKGFMKKHKGCKNSEITNGHDFLQRVKQYLWDEYKISKNEEEIRHLIHAYFTFNSFTKTNLYKSIVDWEERNEKEILKEGER